MSPRDVATVAIRIVAIYFGAQSVIQLASLLSFAADAGGAVPGSLWGAPIALGLVAVLLWVAAGALATSAAAGTADAPTTGAPHPIEHLVGVGLFITGVVFGVQAIVAIISRLILGEESSFVPIVPISAHGEVIYVMLAQLAIAIGLVLWGRATMSTARPSAPAPPPF